MIRLGDHSRTTILGGPFKRPRGRQPLAVAPCSGDRPGCRSGLGSAYLPEDSIDGANGTSPKRETCSSLLKIFDRHRFVSPARRGTPEAAAPTAARAVSGAVQEAPARRRCCPWPCSDGDRITHADDRQPCTSVLRARQARQPPTTGASPGWRHRMGTALSTSLAGGASIEPTSQCLASPPRHPPSADAPGSIGQSVADIHVLIRRLRRSRQTVGDISLRNVGIGRTARTKGTAMPIRASHGPLLFRVRRCDVLARLHRRPTLIDLPVGATKWSDLRGACMAAEGTKMIVGVRPIKIS